VSSLAAAALESIGVAVLLGERVMRVDRDAIVTAAGRRIAAQLKVWSAGIQAPEFLRDLDGLENGRGNTLVVDDRLLTSRDPRVSAIGDCAWCTLRDRKGRTFVVPPRAQSAFQQAFWLARALPERLDGRDVKPFVYRDRGSLVSLSTESTVGQLMGNLMGNVDVEGRIARLMYISLYRRHQSALHGVPRTIVFMLKDALARGAGPRLKLH
jgi:NADH dehydrogenase